MDFNMTEINYIVLGLKKQLNHVRHMQVIYYEDYLNDLDLIYFKEKNADELILLIKKMEGC